MGYNQQYIDWKSGKAGYDWVDCLNFILIANAEVTDATLSPEEMKTYFYSSIAFSGGI